MKRWWIVLSIIVFIMMGCGEENNKVSYYYGSSSVITPRPEFPRPDFQRKDWINLNGKWHFSFDPYDEGVKEKWYINLENISGSIIVPFPWQSSMSGLGSIPSDLDYYKIPLLPRREKHKIGWYWKTFITPPWSENGYRVFLIFGAVDWSADVWINGKFVGSHNGGYTPFEFDITNFLSPPGFRNNLVVRVYDPGSSDVELIPVGKQGDLWYTPSSGIWQTVYLEKRGDVYFKNYTVRSDITNGVVFINGKMENQGSPGPYNFCLRVYDNNGNIYKGCKQIFLYSGLNDVPVSVTINPFQLWSPENPHLYYFSWEVDSRNRMEDKIYGYFAMRKIEIKWAPGHSPEDTDDIKDQYKYIYLNGKPIYIRGVLDQGYNPWGIYTYPSVETMESELRYIKTLGFNAIRIHIKGPDPYKLYLADKLGLFVIYDMPSLKMFANGEDPRGQANYLLTVRGLIERDRNHPSILWWVMFNEDWGLLSPVRVRNNPVLQRWVKEVVDFAKSLDPTRPVEDNSAGGFGAYDHMYTDIQSWHFYLRSYDQVKKHLQWITNGTYPGSGEIWIPGYLQNGQPLINSEFNGIDVMSGNRDVSWFFHWQVNLMRLYPKIQGYVFTQLTDVEFEHNGLLKYDGSKKYGGYEEFGIDPLYLNSSNYLIIDYPPVVTGSVSELIDIPLYFSYFSKVSGPLYVDYRLVGWSGMGSKIMTGFSAPLEFWPKYFDVTYIGELPVKLPDFDFSGAIIFRVKNKEGDIVATNYINVYVPNVTSKIIDVDPSKFSSANWSKGFYTEHGIFYGKGKGCVLYKIPFTFDNIRSVALLLEASSGGVDFANRQTSDEMIWSNIKIFVDNREMLKEQVGEYANSRGFLSYLNNYRLHGSYGKFIRIDIVDPNLIRTFENNKVMKVKVCSSDNGIKLFGKDLGEYPWGIRLIANQQ